MDDKSTKKRGLILKTAYELFALHGYDHTPVSLILEKAGISKGGFYHHFKSKEEIINTIATTQVDAVVEIINKTVGQNDLSAVEKFDYLMNKVQSFRSQNRDELYKLYQPFLNAGNLALKDKIEKYTLVKALPPYVTIIEQGISEGTFQTGNPQLAAETIIRVAPMLRLKMAKLYIDKENNYLDEIGKVSDYLEEFIISILGAKKGSLNIAQLFKSFFRIP